MKTLHTVGCLALSTLAMAALTACGGGGSSDASSSTDTTSSTSAFPTGVSVASPTALSNSTSVVASVSPLRWTQDWALALWDAARAGDMPQLAQVAGLALPLSQAWASTDKVPEAKVASSEIEAVAKGSKSLAQIGLQLNNLFTYNTSNAACFGPSVAYAGHDDGSPTSGTLPSGDLGMWVAVDVPTSQPCAAAELTKKLTTVKHQTHQAMLMAAAMRRIVGASSSLSMPVAGSQTDLTSTLTSVLSAVTSSTTVNAATIALNSAGTIYTYRLVLSRGMGASAESAEVVIRHTPGASANQFTGVMSIAVSQLGTDPNMGCSDLTTTVGGTPYYKTANVTTVRYDRNGTALKFGARSGRYCGAPVANSTDHVADLAATDSNGELDPAVHLSGGNTRGSAKGWRGDFGRFAGDVNKDTQDGDFVYVWQVGNLDGAGRGFAVHAAYNSSTETRTAHAYYGYTAAITGTAASTSNLLGMVCNWAGPGNNHTPNNSFQSQSMTLLPSASVWSLTSSKITYAPTVSCNSSSGMTYDADASGSIGSGEGASVTNDLDSKGLAASVEAAIESRGYTKPTLF